MILLVDCAAHPDLLNRSHGKIKNSVVGWVERSDTHQTLMTNYRRNHITGATYFFTVNLAERPRGLLVEHIELLRHAHRTVRARHPFTIDAMVVLPGHLHAIWTLPAGDADYALRWRLIKTTFSRSVPADEQRSISRHEKGERGVWQRRYWEHTIRDELDYQRHIDYIHSVVSG